MEYNYQEIGERIRNKRKELGYNQDELLDALKEDSIRIGRNTLSSIENGTLPPQKFTMPLIIALCKLFDCDIGYLLGEYNERTRNEKIIQEELHLSSKAISNLKEYMNDSIKHKRVPDLNDILGDFEKKEIPKNETFIYSLNLILEEYPTLIAHIGKIMLHKELGLYTDYRQRGNVRLNKTYDIDKPLLNLVIKLKYYMENKKKIPTKYINDTKRYEYAIQFITKHMQTLEKDNAYLSHCLDEMSRGYDEYAEYE